MNSIVALPIAAATAVAAQSFAAATPAPDAELMSLIDQLWAFKPQIDEARERFEAAEAAYSERAPDFPPAMKWHMTDPVSYMACDVDDVQRTAKLYCKPIDIEAHRNVPFTVCGKFKGTAAERKQFGHPMELSKEEQLRL